MLYRHTELVEGKGPEWEPGVLKNIPVLGEKSKNGRSYAPAAMKRAVKMYEGYNIYLDHTGKPSKGRTVAEHFGRITGVTYDAGTKTVRAGKLEYLRAHPFSAQFEESLERGLNYFGLSHVADGVVKGEGDQKVVSEITRVTSVDLVTNPATCTLLESVDPSASDIMCKVSDLLANASLTKAEKLAAIAELIGDDEVAETPAQESVDPVEGAEAVPDPAVAALAAQVQSLTEQLAALTAKPAPKYLKPRTAAPVTHAVQEQAAPVVPVDPAERRRWYSLN